MEFKILKNRWRSVKVGFNFDMYAWMCVCKYNDIEIFELSKIDKEKIFGDYLYGAYESYCTHNRKRVKYDMAQLEVILDKMTKKQADELSRAVLDSKFMGKSVNDYGGDQKKKK